MRRLAFFLLLMLAGGLPRAQTSSQPAGREATADAQPPGLEVMYACPGGTDFSAVFSKDGDLATLTVPGQPQIELSRQQAGSGFLYGDSYYELRGRGREATLTATGRSMRCHAAGRPGEPPRTYHGAVSRLPSFPTASSACVSCATAPSPSSTSASGPRKSTAACAWCCAAARRRGAPSARPMAID
jgi:membrane-bound inhibitor of C-type lysozyme